MTTPFIINDETDMDVAIPIIDGERASTGCVPRDYGQQPSRIMVGASVPAFKVYTKSELVDIIKERQERGMGLRALRRRKKVPSLNQGQYGYCWAHSPVGMLMMERLKTGADYVPLSAFCVAATIKNGRNEGGWAALALDFLEKHGTCTQAAWPQGNADPRLFNNSKVQEELPRYKVTASWADINDSVYDRNMTFLQVMSLLVSDVPVAGDFYWWGHSVLLFDAVVIDGEPCPVGLNSWGDGWGDLGEFTLQGQRAITNGAVALLTSVAA